MPVIQHLTTRLSSLASVVASLLPPQTMTVESSYAGAVHCFSKLMLGQGASNAPVSPIAFFSTQGLSNSFEFVDAPVKDGAAFLCLFSWDGTTGGVIPLAELYTSTRTVTVPMATFSTFPEGTEPLYTPAGGLELESPKPLFCPRRLTVLVDGVPADSCYAHFGQGVLRTVDAMAFPNSAAVSADATGLFQLDSSVNAYEYYVIVVAYVGATVHTRLTKLPSGSFVGTLDILTTGGISLTVTRYTPSETPAASLFVDTMLNPIAGIGAIPPNVTLTFQVVRNNEQTPSVKNVEFQNQVTAVTVLRERLDSGYEKTVTYSSKILGQWFVQVLDTEEPQLGSIKWPTITDSVVMRTNLVDDEGGSLGGDEGLVTTTVKVNGAPASRQVVVVERMLDDKWRVVGFDHTSAAGEVDVEVKVLPSTQIFAMAIDDWGVAYQAGLSVVVGQRVRPTQYVGWLYEVTNAGVLPATEPDWWRAEGDNVSRLIGTAYLQATRYFRPLAHGPFVVDVTP